METALSKLNSLESADRYHDAMVIVIVQIILPYRNIKPLLANSEGRGVAHSMKGTKGKD